MKSSLSLRSLQSCSMKVNAYKVKQWSKGVILLYLGLEECDLMGSKESASKKVSEKKEEVGSNGYIGLLDILFCSNLDTVS